MIVGLGACHDYIIMEKTGYLRFLVSFAPKRGKTCYHITFSYINASEFYAENGIFLPPEAFFGKAHGETLTQLNPECRATSLYMH